MNEKIKEKFELLLNDCKKSIDRAKETGKGFFTDELYAIRVKEIYKLFMEKGE